VRILGFLDAVKDIGKREAEKYQDEFSDVDSFVEMPADKQTQEIRMWLKVEDVQAETLKVLGISKIDIAEFGSGNDDERIKKRRYLFREAKGQVKPFSPVFKLGRDFPDFLNAEKEPAGEGNKKNIFNRISATLKNLEKRKALSNGSADRIMIELKDNIKKNAGLQPDKNTSYLLIFSPMAEDGHFMYPSEVKAYLSYFRTRIKEQGAGGGKRRQKGTVGEKLCALCHSETSQTVNLDKIFKFATFDKKSFLPGITDKYKDKVFPICQDCYKALSGGRACIDEKFTDSKSIHGVNIYVVPELLMGNADMDLAVQFNDSKDDNFLKKGLSNEGYLSERIMKMDDSVVLHFVFYEKKPNSDKVQLLLMIEDVPPSRLKHIEEIWNLSWNLLSFQTTKKPDFSAVNSAESTLYNLMKLIWSRTMELAGESVNEKSYAKDWLLGIEGKILSGERVNVEEVKKFFVSRFQRLFADHDWVQKKSLNFARDICCIIDFLYRLNEEV